MKALEQLKKIIETEGITPKDGTNARRVLLEDWIESYVTEVEYSQSVIKKSLSLEDEDFIKYYLSYKIGDILMDECIEVESTNNKITTKAWALKRF